MNGIVMEEEIGQNEKIFRHVYFFASGFQELMTERILMRKVPCLYGFNALSFGSQLVS